jgi:cation transport ATPase
MDVNGTLTEGRPRLTAIVPADSITEEELLSAAASVEQNSEHSLAAAKRTGRRPGIATSTRGFAE